MIKGIFDAKIIKNNKKHFKVERKVKVKTLELKKSKPSRAPQARGEASEVSGSRRSPSPPQELEVSRKKGRLIF